MNRLFLGRVLHWIEYLFCFKAWKKEKRKKERGRWWETPHSLQGISYNAMALNVPWQCPLLLLLVNVDCVWNVMTHAYKPDFVFRWNGRVYSNRRGRQFSRLLAAEVCASAVVMLDAPCSEVVWRILGTLSIRQFPFHFPSRASPCAIALQLDCTCVGDKVKPSEVKNVRWWEVDWC